MKVKPKSTITFLVKAETPISKQLLQREIKKAEKGPFYSISQAKKLLKQWRVSRGDK